jgi:hypothetical protein
MMEFGKQISFDELKKRMTPGDTNVYVKAGIVVQGNMGSLIAMRDAIEKYMVDSGGALVYFTITGQPLYLVHYNDLNESKQKNLEKKGKTNGF